MIKNLGSSTNPSWSVRAIIRRPKNLGGGFVERKRSGIANRRQAEQIERELYAEAKAIAQNGMDSTWEIVAKTFLGEIHEGGSFSPKTLENYRYQLENHSLPFFGTKRLNAITRQDVLTYLQERFGHRTENTRKTNLKYISAVFRYGIQNRLCSFNPCEGIRFKVAKRDLKIWNRDQVKRFLTLASNAECEWLPIWHMALLTGMRNGELFALQWKHIDLVTGIITVCQSWSSKIGIKSTKTGQVRKVGINQNLRRVLKSLENKAPSNPEDFVLPRLNKWTKGEQSRELRMFLMGLDLPMIRFHDLRAIFASQLLLSGKPIHLVQLMCGWTDLKTAQRYLRLSGHEVVGSTESLDYGFDFEDHAGGQVISLTR